MEILINSEKYIEEQAELLYKFYKDYPGRAMNYSDLDTYVKLLKNRNLYCTHYTAVESKIVLGVIIVNFNGSIFFESSNDQYDVDMIAYSSFEIGLDLINFLRNRVTKPISLFKTNQHHQNLNEELIKIASWYSWRNFTFIIDKDSRLPSQNLIDDIWMNCNFENNGEFIHIKSITKNCLGLFTGILGWLYRRHHKSLIVDDLIDIIDLKDSKQKYMARDKLYHQLEGIFGIPKIGNYIYIIPPLSLY